MSNTTTIKETISNIKAEVEKLHREIENRYTLEEVTAWLAEYHGKYREIPMSQWIRNRRQESKGQ